MQTLKPQGLQILAKGVIDPMAKQHGARSHSYSAEVEQAVGMEMPSHSSAQKNREKPRAMQVGMRTAGREAPLTMHISMSLTFGYSWSTFLSGRVCNVDSHKTATAATSHAVPVDDQPQWEAPPEGRLQATLARTAHTA